MKPFRWTGAAAAPLTLGLLGCDLFGAAHVEGRLLSGPDPEDAPVAGAVVAIYDMEGLRLGHDDTAADGSFEIHDLPTSIPVATVADRPPDHAPTVFVGNLGTGTMTVPDGGLFALPLDEAQALIDGYGDLSVGQTLDFDTPDDGGAVVGQVWADVGGGVLIPLSGVSVEVLTTSESYGAVYLDDAAEPDADLAATSALGAFAVFRLPPGTWAALIGVALSDGSYGYVEIAVMVVEDGITLLDGLVFQTGSA